MAKVGRARTGRGGWWSWSRERNIDYPCRETIIVFNIADSLSDIIKDRPTYLGGSFSSSTPLPFANVCACVRRWMPHRCARFLSRYESRGIERKRNRACTWLHLYPASRNNRSRDDNENDEPGSPTSPLPSSFFPSLSRSLALFLRRRSFFTLEQRASPPSTEIKMSFS